MTIALSWSLFGPAVPILALALACYLPVAFLVDRFLPRRRALGWPNRVTLLRATFVCMLAGALARPSIYATQPEGIIALSIAALLLDGLDGWLARKRGEAGEFGARFDMETDAALILVLCLGLWLSGLAPAWVLAIGLIRPVFVAAAIVRPWLSRPLPDRLRRKLVCVVQVGVLPVALLPSLSENARVALLAVAGLALAASFAIDIAWLYRHRRATGHPQWRIS